MEVSFKLHSPAALLLGKCPKVSTEQESGWLHSRSRQLKEEKNVLPLPVAYLSYLLGWCGSQGLKWDQKQLWINDVVCDTER
jgi:hypothetical protein